MWECFGGVSGNVQGNSLDLVVTLALGGVIGNREAMVLNLAGAKNQIELGANQVLQHRADVIGAAGVRLNLFCLLK